ncbi:MULTISPECIES: TetR/AcrR family transcriptional regulator [Streptomyces]|jgi:TetR/AcrR family transcriptional repressor of nem operon|uniref:TetR/AcrR family transcriptional regulator n=1 Tax=Streptomyces TaxID=1883 RepID=UPI000D529805|nr:MULTISPECIES: TetR family transcriptional regulator [Streptomyces]AWE48539.1 TetR family transcriptional regulator [Streptomyces nigra]MCF2534462.1 TetR family transcriptional regulator [Streptomyces sp. FB2]
MGRASKAQAQENRQRVVETASRLFREQGTQVSVADLMKAVGLTHGGFYKQFASKEALVDEATAHAFEEFTRQYLPASGSDSAPDSDSGDTATQEGLTQEELIDVYLSAEHRDNAADGCPLAGFAPDRARATGDSEAHRVYAQGARDFAEALATEDQNGLTRLSTLVGALTLARATKGTPISDEILDAARAALTESD